MAPFLNTESLKFSNESIFPLKYVSRQQNLTLFDHLLEISFSVARQTMLLSLLDHKNIPSILKQRCKYAHQIFQVPYNTFLSYITSDNNNYNVTIRDVLHEMHDIVSAVEYLHEKKIAHGDIELTNFFMADNNNIVLSGLERFSMFSEEKEQVLGIKKFKFPAKISYAPEFSHPLDNNKSLFTNASFEGDIWSLGFVLAGILYRYYQDCFDINKLKIGAKLGDYLYQQKSSSLFFKVIPAKVATIIPRFIFSLYSCADNILNRSLSSLRSQCYEFQQAIEDIIEIINSCHRLSPKERPTATEIKNQLDLIIRKNNDYN